MTDPHPLPHASRRALLGGALAGGAVLLAAQPAQAAPLAAAGLAAAPAQVLLRDAFQPVPGWERRGVILQRDLPWETDILQDPSCVYASGSGPLFKVWYGSLHGIGYATSEDGLTWTKRPEALLLPTLETERGYLNQPSVVLKDGLWHMTYFGMDTAGIGRIHYAVATQPDGPFQRKGVVLAPTAAWEDGFLYNSSLLYDATAGLWKMWYTAGKIASAGGEPEFICYATATRPEGPWTKHPANPLVRPMEDGGWASLGVGGPNVRKLADGTYESRVIGWQADHPSRGGRMTSPDGLAWTLDRSRLDLDLGVVGGPEDSMIYRSYAVEHQGRTHLLYNVKNNRPGWNETIQLAVWSDSVAIIDPAKWAMTHAAVVPTGASFEVRDGAARSLGNAPRTSPQALQGNTLLPAPDYAVSVAVTPTASTPEGRDTVVIARSTTRGDHYYAGISAWGNRYAIGRFANGQNTKLAGVGSASEIIAGVQHRLRFELEGAELRLFDDSMLVLSTTDTTHRPEASYVGLQSSYGFGTAEFRDLSVTRLGAAPVQYAATATVSTRCLRGSAYVTVTCRNQESVPLRVVFDTAFGARTFASVAPGSSATHAFTTRTTSLAAGSVTVLLGEADAVEQRVLGYAPRAC
ncbi:hypothetical protein [Rathayibacter sp. Leaf296]|uniref:hypothetical protein n=1 Tax=Rathayibacter sp. Leaf296 TaxID=1736327 RepID=UPI00070322D9|nr:hypothetical protein [Rathayibacter sp. Leaf296]KQQ09688.1 hypothetical protein ASF46_00705 [Rathayibacter sp. Leaf296]